MAFPIFQVQEQRHYPDPRSMVVNWAAAGDKILKGAVEGIELGMKVKQSRENSALNAMNIQRSQVAINATLQEMRLNEKRTEQTLRLDAIEQRNRELDYARKTSADAQRTYDFNAAIQAAQAERTFGAMQALVEHESSLSDLMVNRGKLLAELDATSDFSSKRAIIDEYKREASEFEIATGRSLLELASALPPNDQRAQLIAGLQPAVLETAFQNTMVAVEMPRTIVSDPMLSGDDSGMADIAMALGKGGLTKTDTTIKLMPLNQAVQIWKAGSSLNTLRELYDTAVDKKAFEKWAAKEGLSKRIVAAPMGKTEVPVTEKPAVPETVKVTTPDGKTRDIVNPYPKTQAFTDAVKSEYDAITNKSPFFLERIKISREPTMVGLGGTGAVAGYLRAREKVQIEENPEIQAREIDYYERAVTDTRKKINELKGSDIKTLNRKLELNSVLQKLEEQLKSLRQKYMPEGSQETPATQSTPLTTEAVSEADLPVLTFEEAKLQPSGTRFKTADGRFFKVP